MKTLMILFGMMMAAPAFAACGVSGLPVIDWGLHRQYVIERDCAHMERPATLVEVPWSDAAATRAREQVRMNASPVTDVLRPPYVVHAGTRVMLTRLTPGTAIQLVGTALDQGRAGQSVRVRAGLHGATLRGIVRGPGLVELDPGRGRN
ncbi:MAG: flagella basal body P-ring formation protein FlgA [Acidobacteriaceae bacterium]